MKAYIAKYCIYSLALFLIMTCASTSLAEDKIVPTPPSWISPDEYIIYENSYIYEKDTWQAVLELRKLIEGGNDFDPKKYSELYGKLGYTGNPALHFEILLLTYKMFLNGYNYHD